MATFVMRHEAPHTSLTRGSKTADRAIRADLKRLADLGVVTITAHTIEFADSIEQITVTDDLESFWRFFKAIPNRGRSVPVPRRTLRALAAGFRKAETGYILAALICSVFYNVMKRPYRVDGRFKGGWVAGELWWESFNLGEGE